MRYGLLLIRRRRPIGEPGVAETPDSGEIMTIDGTAGAGRIALALAEAGLQPVEMLQAVIPPEIDLDELRALELGGTFGTVVLGSHLVNLPDEPRRAAHVEVAAGHVAPRGSLVLEHHPVDWAETAADVEPTPGSSVGMEGVRRDPPFVSAVSIYDVGGRMTRQPFTARVLSEAELSATLERVGFAAARRLSPTLIQATRGIDMQDLRSGHAIREGAPPEPGRDQGLDHQRVLEGDLKVASVVDPSPTSSPGPLPS